ncbi:MAG: radical SAM protein [Anaerolineae bacterium]|nr:radical SAM protein [Anaerolineae bacterium]
MSIRKVILIQPGRDGRVLGRATSEPYTLMRLASLVPAEIPVEIWDEDLMRLPIAMLGPHDLVGITAKTLLVDRAKRIAQAVQRQGATVVMGGTHTTLVPEEVEGWADAIAVGEGYRTWPQIIRDFDRGVLQKRYTDEEWTPLDSGVAVLQDRVLRQVDEHRNYWTPYLEITRGCPRNCTFCTAIRVSGQKMRLRPVEEVIEEIERRRLRRFFLTDDNFGLNFRLHPEYMEQLFRRLAKLPLAGWTCQAEQMVAEYPDLLALAHEAHLEKFFIGFESINPGNRRELGGKARGEAGRAREVIRQVHAHGIGVVGLFVVGFDSDTPETFPALWDFVRTSELDGVSVTILTPYPGTVQRRELLAAGRILPHETWEKYNTNHVTYIPAQMTVEQLQQGYDWLCRKIYGSSQIVRRGLRSLLRNSPGRARQRLFSSFSTDLGYRRETAHRYDG